MEIPIASVPPQACGTDQQVLASSMADFLALLLRLTCVRVRTNALTQKTHIGNFPSPSSACVSAQAKGCTLVDVLARIGQKRQLDCVFVELLPSLIEILFIAT